MTEQAREARRAYKRKWAQENPEKVKQQQARYWERKAAEQAQEQAQEREPASPHPAQPMPAAE